MKQLKYILLATVLLWACDGNKPGDESDVTLGVTPTELTFGNEDNAVKFVNVATQTAWTATVTESWVHLKNASGSGYGSFSVSVDAYTGSTERSANITVKAADKSASVKVRQGSGDAPVAGVLVPKPKAFDGTKRSNTAYQLLIYSFADSDGDGVGDFKGIQNKLDYLDGLGVTALWLSPAHPTSSYHAYDVTDYYALNPLYAVGEKTSAKAEKDFKDLLAAAHAKGIAIYMDYVLNHTGKDNPWFKEALADPSGKYRDYYFFSSNPSSDYSKFPMLKGTTYQSGEWKQAVSGSPKITITSTSEAVTNGTVNWDLYYWQGSSNAKTAKFVDKGDGTYYLVMDINGSIGILTRKGCDWSGKFGAKGDGALAEGTPMDLVWNGGDITFTGNGRYRIELSNLTTQTVYYMGCFSDSMPDLNYGDVSAAENNACFQDLAASADKWIAMGVDGLRLDAVKHICGGINSYNNTSNQTLLTKWYEHCNATYKTAGGQGNIFMVAEAWDGHNVEKQYYKALTSCFEFDYGYAVRDMLKGGNASGFANKVAGFVSDHSAVRSDAVTSLFLSNHDQNRFASEVGETGLSKFAKRMQAGAILLSGGGKPWIYQGEELGYYGKKDNGDEYVRTPMMWDKAGTDCAKSGVNNKVDSGMLKAEISVEAQSADDASILNVYKTWSQLRNTYDALATGTMSAAGLSGSSIAAWYMAAGSQKLLVVHNVASSQKKVTVNDSMAKPVAVLGTAAASGTELTLGPNSSVVFEL